MLSLLQVHQAMGACRMCHQCLTPQMAVRAYSLHCLLSEASVDSHPQRSFWWRWVSSLSFRPALGQPEPGSLVSICSTSIDSGQLQAALMREPRAWRNQEQATHVSVSPYARSSMSFSSSSGSGSLSNSRGSCSKPQTSASFQLTVSQQGWLRERTTTTT